MFRGTTEHIAHQGNSFRSTDVLFLPPQKAGAKKMLVVISGTHGIEGHIGSFLQFHMLNEVGRFARRQVPADVGLLFIHALNSWGYAHDRRTDNNNVDLNRNGTEAFVSRADYKKYASILKPEIWNREVLDQLRTIVHDKVFRDATFGGQHDDPTGIFYGGESESQCVAQLRTILKTYASDADEIAVVDIHSGIGEYARGEIIAPFTSTKTPEARKLKKWLGLGIQYPNAGKESVSSPVSGDILSAITRWMPGKIYPIALEFGVLPIEVSLPSIVAENWVYHHPGVIERETEEGIRRSFRASFYPDNDDFWHGAAWSRFRDVVESMLLGLARS